MVTITALPSGFHTLSPLNAALAPNVFLNMAQNVHGQVQSDPAGETWQTLDSLQRDDYQIRLIADPLVPGGPWQATLTVRGITYFRVENGEEVPIGTLTFDPPLTLAVTATADAAGTPTGWTGALGEALADALQAQGVTFLGGEGDDTFVPANSVLPMLGPAILLGRGGDDILHGGREDTVIRGGSGHDILTDDGGTDRLLGGAGNDTITLGTFSTGSLAKGGRGDDHLTSGNGADRLHGNRGDDRLDGGRGDDRMTGGAGVDILNGGEGNDRLSGGRGDDCLTGGLGADTFVFRAGQAGHDQITDFDPLEGDTIVLRGLTWDEVQITAVGDDTLISWNDGASEVRLIDVAPDAPVLEDMILV